MMNDRSASDYFLFFATRSILGLQKMKEAMWHIDPAGGVRFSDATNFDQHVLFEPSPDTSLLRRMLEARFARSSVTVRDIERFVLADTAFHARHYKSVLRELEIAGRLIPVSPPPKRRRGRFADARLIVQFT
jgi:hypothetical protein